MATVTGIFLGFTLNFASHWVSTAFANDRLKEFVIGVGLFICTTLLLFVLYRILNMNYPKDKAESYYRNTLILFVTGVGTAFLAILIAMVESFVINRL